MGNLCREPLGEGQAEGEADVKELEDEESKEEVALIDHTKPFTDWLGSPLTSMLLIHFICSEIHILGNAIVVVTSFAFQT